MVILRYILFVICFLLNTLQSSHAKVELYPHTSLSHTPSLTPVDASNIKTREIQLGIPADTGVVQMMQIQRAIEYGKSNNVKIIITRIEK